MLIGVNWTYPQTFPLIKKLIDHQLIDFCEITVDNFIHLAPSEIINVIPNVPIALHILKSRFLEKSPAELASMAQHLRPWLQAIQPIYISDHLAQFTTATGRQYPLAMELAYEQNDIKIKNSITAWQELLGEKLYLENFASHLMLGKNQPAIFEKLMQETGAGLLFDFSNAYIAELNGVCAVNAWQPLLAKTQHFHVAGFRTLESPPLAVDTHDTAIAESVLSLIAPDTSKLSTCVVEFDANMSFELWEKEIQRLKNRMTV